MLTRSRFALGLVAGAALGIALVHAPFSLAAPADAAPATAVREFKVLGTDYRGSKRWEPATLICYQGETVRITLINKIPAEPPTHGFTIAAFNVKEEIAANTEKVIEFVADKPGLHTINCHLHPKHIGGQLLVLAK